MLATLEKIQVPTILVML